MVNKPNILSNELDQVPKTWERYGKELNDTALHAQIIDAFDSNQKENNKEKLWIELESEDFFIDKPKDTVQDYTNKKLTENWDIRETYSGSIFLQKFTFNAAKREVEKTGKSLLASATIFQDTFINVYKWDKEAFIKWENLTVTNLIDDWWFNIWPWFMYVFADWSIFAMFNTDVINKKKERDFFGIYKDNANNPILKDQLFSVRLAK